MMTHDPATPIHCVYLREVWRVQAYLSDFHCELERALDHTFLYPDYDSTEDPAHEELECLILHRRTDCFLGRLWEDGEDVAVDLEPSLEEWLWDAYQLQTPLPSGE